MTLTDLKLMEATNEQVAEARRSMRLVCDKHLEGKDDGMIPQVFALVRGLVDDGKGGFCLGEPTPSLFILDTDFSDQRDKHAAMYRVGQLMCKEQRLPVIVGFMSECWISHEVVGAPRKYLTPEDDPNRLEALTIVLRYGKTVTHDFRVVKRGENNGMLPDGDWQTSDSAESALLDHLFRGYFSRILGKMR